MDAAPHAVTPPSTARWPTSRSPPTADALPHRRGPGLREALLGPGGGRQPSRPSWTSRGAFGAPRGPGGARSHRSSWPAGAARCSPAEVVRVDPAARTPVAPHPLQRREGGGQLDWPPLQEFWFTNAQGPPHPQLRGPAPGLRSREEVPAARAHPRRAREHVARPDHAALELPPAGQPGLRRAPHRLPRLHRLRRGVHARHPGRPPARPRRRHQPGRRRGHQALSVHRRHAAGRGRRELRRPPGQLAGGHHHPLQVPDQPRRPVQPAHAVGHQRHHPPPRADDGRAVLGEHDRPGWTRARSPTRRTSRRRCCSPWARTTSACP